MPSEFKKYKFQILVDDDDEALQVLADKYAEQVWAAVWLQRSLRAGTACESCLEKTGLGCARAHNWKKVCGFVWEGEVGAIQAGGRMWWETVSGRFARRFLSR